MGDTLAEEAVSEKKLVLPTEIYDIEGIYIEKSMGIGVDVDRLEEAYTTAGLSKETYRKSLEQVLDEELDDLSFWNMLATYVPRTGFQLPEGRRTKVLNLACGSCLEGRVLRRYFSGSDYYGIGFGRDIELVEIDHDPDEIKKAIANNSSRKGGLPENIRFLPGDARDLSGIPQVPKQIDVVLIRHQQLVGKPGQDPYVSQEIWTEIFSEAVQKVAPEGIVIISSYSGYEHEKLKECIKTLSCEIIIDERNPYFKPMEDIGALDSGFDCNVLILRKK